MLMPQYRQCKSLSIIYELRGEALHSQQEFTRSSLCLTGLNRLECMLTDSLCKAFPQEKECAALVLQAIALLPQLHKEHSDMRIHVGRS